MLTHEIQTSRVPCRICLTPTSPPLPPFPAQALNVLFAPIRSLMRVALLGARVPFVRRACPMGAIRIKGRPMASASTSAAAEVAPAPRRRAKKARSAGPEGQGETPWKPIERA